MAGEGGRGGVSVPSPSPFENSELWSVRSPTVHLPRVYYDGLVDEMAISVPFQRHRCRSSSTRTRTTVRISEVIRQVAESRYKSKILTSYRKYSKLHTPILYTPYIPYPFRLRLDGSGWGVYFSIAGRKSIVQLMHSRILKFLKRYSIVD